MLILATGLLGLLLTLSPRLFRLGWKEVAVQPELSGEDSPGLLQIDTVSKADSLQRERLFSVRRQPSIESNNKQQPSVTTTPPLAPRFSERISTDNAFPPDLPVPMAGLDTIPSMKPLQPLR